MGKPFATWGELEKTYRFVALVRPELFGADFPDANAVRVAAMAEGLQAANGHGGAREGAGRLTTEVAAERAAQQAAVDPEAMPAGRRNQGSITTLNFPQDRGTSYLVRRLKRDHPAIVERMKAGEFRSVRAAAVEAGIVKVPSGTAHYARRIVRNPPDASLALCASRSSTFI